MMSLPLLHRMPVKAAMLNRYLFYYAVFFFLLITGWIYLYLPVTSLDQSQFLAQQQSMHAAAESKTCLTQRQHREKVCKDLWITQEDGSRLNHKITSEYSALVFVKKKGKLSITEHLTHLSCFIQDKVMREKEGFYQQIRSFKAQNGSYNYMKGQLTASNAFLSFFKLPGVSLPLHIHTSPYLIGRAEDIHLTLSGKSPQFEANHFQAYLE